jgi:serine/threonine-protein kinase
MLGRYRIEREVGSGATGIVYRGRDATQGQLAALKTMTLAHALAASGPAQAREQFFREAETARRLVHPNIVTIYEVAEAHGVAYIAMEFLEGTDLVPYTRPDQLLPLARMLSIVARVADALAHAHRRGVVHRDVKPANVLYEPVADTVKVTDFGIASVADPARSHTGPAGGTPLYMSPEQLAGRDVNASSDIFSLGVMLFQLASGEVPFRADSMALFLHRVANERHADIRACRPCLPECVIAIIDRSLAKDPRERYRSAGHMARALRSSLARLDAGTVHGCTP